MKKKILSLSMVLCMVTGMGLPVYAKNNADTILPEKFVTYTTYANTGLREKQDTSSNYIKNTSGFSLWVRSYNSNNANYTANGHAIVPTGGEYFVRNYIYENGFRTCKLNISSAVNGVSGKVKGVWSPDSVGNYPYAN